MTEQQPVEAQQATPVAGEGQAQSQSESQAPAPTVQQVEAEYKARLSGKDKAHAAEVAELRRQLEAAQQTGTSAATETQQATATVEELKRQLAEAQNANKQQAQRYEQTLRSTKYPHAAEALDPQTLATMDEAKLAGLNARLAPSSPAPAPGRVDPSTPAREAAPKPTTEKSVEELKADLAKYGPQFAASLNVRE